MIRRASRKDYENAMAPHNHPDQRWGYASETAKRATEEDWDRKFEELVLPRSAEKILRDQDMAAAHNQPDRLEESHIRNNYRGTSPRWLGFRVTRKMN